MGFFSQLEERAKQIDSLLCIGLDPHLADLQAPDSKSALDFCLRLVETTSEVALAYKPNIAFFEIFGSSGIAALETVIANIPEEIPVILDAKRGDIASSAQSYARAIFKTLGANAVTANPYLGYDAIEPFLKDEQRGVFLLCKTSNPGAGDIQDLNISFVRNEDDTSSPVKIYELIATKALEWNKNDNLGLVVGATQLDALTRVRELAPDLWFLAPGVGAQGADLAAALSAGLRSDGLGMIIPVSRGISRESDPGLAARDLNSKINLARWKLKQPTATNTHPIDWKDQDLKKLAIELLESGCVKFGEFKLKSGLHSPLYIDLRRLVGYPGVLSRVAESYLLALEDINFDRLAALPYAGLPIATAISLQGNYPLIYPRKEIKAYGTQAEIEGVYSTGERVVLIDDLATTGGSKFEAIEKLQAAGLIVKDVLVLIDRQSGAAEDLSKSGYRMHAVFTLTQLLDYWSAAEMISKDQVSAVLNFISIPGSRNSQ
jgi:uridine monophosphate synthetase